MTPTIVIITVLAYFAVLFGVSHLTSRNSDNAAFFNGNRRAPWPLVAFAMVGAAISGVTFISVPGMVVDKGYSYLQMVLGFIVGYWVIAFVLVPLFYKRNLLSIYGYLGERFGSSTYRTGAWFFFVSKMLGAAVRFFVVCIVLQTLVCDPLGIPFVVNVAVTIAIVWLYTFRGGVKTLIWTDTLKSFCLIMSVVLCIWFIAQNLDLSWAGVVDSIGRHGSSRIFYFDDPSRGVYFWKQFLAGVFMAIAINGLDQDMMQRNLACRDSRQSQKNMIVSGVMQFFVIALFLVLGTLLVIYVESTPSLSMPEKSDELFGLVAAHESLPVAVGVLFILGLVSAAYSAAGSALTSLTTSFTVDILDASGMEESRLARVRKWVHIAMSATMGLVIVVFYMISEEDAISAVYTLASYTYGPILGLFVFGMFTKRPVNDRLVPVVCIAAPCLCWLVKYFLNESFGYEMSFELLIFNALLTAVGLSLLPGKASVSDIEAARESVSAE
ncbi:sodium:solute symporter [uncultured Muribaculum sp.]|uniref:sodium:solute symporter n=1 Tax=uncultured Muribaculum sp. TaxID=1918613 RepID=UPI00265B0754|nr:sodium:solute symporter [uncultured Muribaculum sp.]